MGRKTPVGKRSRRQQHEVTLRRENRKNTQSDHKSKEDQELL